MFNKRHMPEYDELLSRAMRYCTFQERCLQEVHAKLRQWKAGKKETSKIISDLVENNYINEDRFASVFAISKFRNNNWGKVKIVSVLRRKGIPERTIAAATAEIDEEEYLKILRELLLKKLRNIPEGHPLSKKQKLLTFALGKGYESDLVYRTINNIEI